MHSPLIALAGKMDSERYIAELRSCSMCCRDLSNHMSWDAREHDEEVGRMMKEEAGLKDACY